MLHTSYHSLVDHDILPLLLPFHHSDAVSVYYRYQLISLNLSHDPTS